MSLASLTCPHCGAALPPGPREPDLICRSCGTRIDPPRGDGSDARETVPDLSDSAPGAPATNRNVGAAPEGAPSGLPVVPGYEVLRELGRGGMGVVYQARQLSLKRVVALKMIRSRTYAGAEELARFKTEAEAVARLAHPNIVQVHEVGECDGHPFFSLEFVEGGSLDKKLAGTPFAAAEAARLAQALARAMHAAHQKGVLHRDLKPANVLLTADGTPKVSDFGLAKQLDADLGQTQSGQVLGTPSYMAPEQAEGRARDVGPRTDVYALGAILYEMLTGRPPFKGASMFDTLDLVRTADPVPPRQLQPKVPRDLETVCLKCLEKEPSRRYASAEELADDLQRFLAQRPVKARPASVADRATKFVRRNKVLVGGVTAVIVALLFGLVRTRLEADRAQTAEQNALGLANEVQGRLAESYVDQARLSQQQGLWTEAIELYDKALEAGHAQDVDLKLRKARAWFAVNRPDKAGEVLEELKGRDDLGDREAEVLLFEGDSLLTKDNARAEELIRQAQARGLRRPADRHYAEGLLAADSPTAVEHFRAALREDPYHYPAHAMLGVTLLLLGRRAEARDHLAGAEALFPKEPNLKMFRAVALALDGDLPAAKQAAERTRGQFRDEETDVLLAILELVHELRRWDELSDFALKFAVLKAWVKMLPAMRRVMPDAPAAPDEKALLNAGKWMRVPPFLRRVVDDLTVGVLGLAGADQEKTLTRFDAALRVHPEGTLRLIKAYLLGLLGRHAEAAAEFARAADEHSVVPVRRVALTQAALAEGAVAFGKAPDAEAGKRAVRHLREALRLGIQPENAADLAVVAAKAGEVGLARTVLDEWQRAAPNDPEVWRWRAAAEMRAGAYAEALRSADRYLKHKPDDKEVLGFRKAAVEKLRELVGKLDSVP